MVPTKKSRKFPSLVIQLQLERAASPRLIPRREPPHTSPTAPTACPTTKIPPASEAASSSSALSRRPQLSQAHGPLLSQALYPRFKSAPKSQLLASALQCLLLASALQWAPQSPLLASAPQSPRLPSAL